MKTWTLTDATNVKWKLNYNLFDKNFHGCYQQLIKTSIHFVFYSVFYAFVFVFMRCAHCGEIACSYEMPLIELMICYKINFRLMF